MKSLNSVVSKKDKLVRGVENNAEDKSISFDWHNTKYSERTKNNLSLSNINPVELKNILNETPSKFAYWSSMLADVNLELSKLERKYSFWYANKYMEVFSSSKKKLTETQIKNLLMTKYPKTMEKYLIDKENLLCVKSKVGSITKSYDMSSKTLQSISSIMKQELAILKS